VLDNLSECVGHGRVAEVYRWEEDCVVKVFRAGTCRAAVEAERRNMAMAWDLGLPVPEPGGIVELAGRLGLVMEAVSGESMMAHIMRSPRQLADFARQLADLHTVVNRLPGPAGLPPLAEVLTRKIRRAARLRDAERDRILALLSEMPSGRSLCHGDFHPGNLVVRDREVVIIDWSDASRGPAMADVARTSLLFGGHIALQEGNPDAQAPMVLYRDTYLERRLAAVDGDREEFGRWHPILAAARLAEGIDEQMDWLHGEVLRGLAG
jgi:Ser/Thr protein kinase RdoA (MazF antagonist)